MIPSSPCSRRVFGGGVHASRAKAAQTLAGNVQRPTSNAQRPTGEFTVDTVGGTGATLGRFSLAETIVVLDAAMGSGATAVAAHRVGEPFHALVRHGLSVEDYTLLEWLNAESADKLYGFLNRIGCCGWTVCPICRIDDFTHFEGCSLSKNLRKSSVKKRVAR
jgi:hypothetical protein